MARRGSLTFANTTLAANTGAITISSGWTGSTPSPGDQILLIYCISKSTANPTVTGPTVTSAVTDMNVVCSQGTTTLGVKIWKWTGSETTIQLATSGTNFYAIALLAYSGRASSPLLVTPAITGPVGVGGGTPQSLSITGLTANAGDDLVLVIGGNQTNSTTDSYSLTAPSGYGNTINTEAAATNLVTQHGTADKQNVSAGATGTLTGSLANTGGEGIAYGGWLISLAQAPVLLGALPSPGPGISPSIRDQFHVPIRDTSAQSGVMAGQSYSVSTSYGNFAATSNLTGQSYSASAVFGQLIGAGAPTGVSYSVSLSTGLLTQLQGGAVIPSGGPGISPSTLFQFSTMILDETLFQIVVLQGFSTSASLATGAITGAGAVSGLSTSVSMSYGTLSAGGIGALAGVSFSVSTSYGQLLAPQTVQATGVSYSVSSAFGAMVSISPAPPTACVNLWSADGRSAWSADGFPGISADGYEPTPLQCAVTAFAHVGVNVGALTYVYSPYGVPVGWVITGYVPFITALNAGEYIPLTISEGPAPPPTLITVPNVVGKFYYDAQLAILDAGFLIAAPQWVLNSGVLPQYVISQSIPAGQQFTQATQITIVVSAFPVTNQPGIVVGVP
jgi:hypothetical protein